MSAEVYLDHAATSWPKPSGVLEAVVDFFTNAGGNMGRAGHHRSIASSRVVSLARENLADLLGAESPDNLVFTKNATEALNVAINGLAVDGARIVTSSLEHNSVMRPLRYLESTGRATLVVVPADGNTGELDLDAWAEALRGPGPRLAIATHASNVTGVVLPIAGLSAAARDAGVAMVVDASQSAGHIPLSLSELGATAVAMPGHKGLLGPMGTGLLYLAPDVEMEPLIRGGTGSQSELETQPDFAPDRYESGTLNGPGIVGLGAAAEYLSAVGIAEVHAHATALCTRFRDALAGVEELTLYGPEDPASNIGILSVNIAGSPCATVSRLLDDEWGVMTRAGLHCSPAAHRSLGTAPDGTVRLSWGYDTTEEQIDVAAEALRTIAARVSETEPARTVA
ncbi:MAG TPA: aminotransferase class V-fold PLP-dependent enzyme [Gaiellaceae bacterium]|nr:aminotransferase class V-fold PLP-dependent enzyme [Gaiellaceae bacterium]